MNIEKLWKLQTELDQMVMDRSKVKLDSYENIEFRMYAFHTEVHELANEVGFFKYWKLSHKMKEAEVIEELIDCIHFLLSVGITKGYNRVIKEVEPFPLWKEYEMLDLFKEVRRNELDSVGRWEIAFSLLLGIGKKCGFTQEQMLKEYSRKNTVNRERQKEGY